MLAPVRDLFSPRRRHAISPEFSEIQEFRILYGFSRKSSKFARIRYRMAKWAIGVYNRTKVQKYENPAKCCTL